MENNQLFQKIFESVTLGMALCELVYDGHGNSIDNRFLKVNPAFEIQTEMNGSAIIGKTIKEIFPDIEHSWIERFSSTVLENKPIQFVEYNRNTNKHYRVNAFSPAENKFVMLFEDVTAEKLAADELIKSEKNYRNIMNTMYDMFQVVELVYDENKIAIDYRYLQVNPAFEKLVQKKKSELIGKRAKEVFGIVEDYWIETYDRVGKTGIPEYFENYGAELDKYYGINAWKLDDGQVAIAFRDITNKKIQEKELIKAKDKAEESDRLKSAFLANMSHEIRTPMNGILGFANLLKNNQISGEEQQNYIRIIEKSGVRMLNIINDIINISKIESGMMEVNISDSNLNEQIEYIYAFFKPETEKKGLQFLIKNALPLDKAIIRTDREKLFAILTNLVKNAIKFTTEGTIELGYTVKNKSIEFYVKDSGIGIEAEQQHLIFKRFIQVDSSDKSAFQGAGLGLSISKAFVELLGGELWVESEIGKGAVFYFSIPFNLELAPETKNKTGNFSSTQEPKSRNLKVLIVEDDKISALLLTVILEPMGTIMFNAENGIEAIDACRKNPDLDLIFMDINMPEMGGYEAVRRIREFNDQVIIIAQTANGLSRDREKALAAGCNEYISKPIIKKELLPLVNKYFSEENGRLANITN